MHLRRYLVAGLLVWLPIGVTVLVFKVLLDLMDGLLFLVPTAYQPETLLGFRVPGVGAVLALIVLFATGILVANLIGRQLVRWGESLLARIPLVRSVYSAVKTFSSVLLSSGKSFRKVLLIEYPRKGVWRLGFLTSDEPHEVKAATGRDIVAVFVPNSANAAGGFLVFVPREDVTELAMSVEDALKMVVSLGVVMPAMPPPRAASLTEKATAFWKEDYHGAFAWCCAGGLAVALAGVMSGVKGGSMRRRARVPSHSDSTSSSSQPRSETASASRVRSLGAAAPAVAKPAADADTPSDRFMRVLER